MIDPLRLGTRSSPLALWQANHVAALLEPLVAPQTVVQVHVETHGDRDQASALSSLGGFGVFTKAIQTTLLDRKADVAVHSLKDLPTIPTDGLHLAATPGRGPIGDAFVSTHVRRFEDLPTGATVGTSSLRRRAMLWNRRPDLKLVELRGNVDTRLRKLDEQHLDAVVLAEAGLVRLGLGHRIVEILDTEWMLPAVGQGAIGLECRSDDAATTETLEQITHVETWRRVTAERALLAALGGGCLVPIGTVSSIADGVLTIRGMVLSGDGRRRISASHRGPAETPIAIGQELAAMLRDEGATEVLADGEGR